MPRRRRVVLPEVPHHVIFRGNNRRKLFSYVRERALMLDCVERGLSISGCALHQLTLMTNHVHLIITPPVASALSVFVHRTCQRYAQRRNRRRSGSGKLFEERYVSKPILDDAQLVTTTLYNDANAYRAGLTGDPFGHAWSTGPLHAGVHGSRIPVRLWTPSSWYLGLGKSLERRAMAYRAAMVTYAAAGHGDALPAERDAPYKRRLERPDGSSAREVPLRFGPGRK